MNGPALLHLQRLDTELEQIAGRRRRLPEHEVLATATAAHRTWAEATATLRRTIDEASGVIAAAERDGAALDVKQQRLEAQLKTVIAPREAEALMSQIATLKAQHGELDDVELAAMERQAEAEGDLAALATQEELLVADVAAAQTALDAALAVLVEEEQQVAARRAEAATALTGDELRRYDDLRQRHQGVAIVTLEGHRCSGCHLDISPAELDVIRHTTGPDLPDCPQCGRLVVV